MVLNVVSGYSVDCRVGVDVCSGGGGPGIVPYCIRMLASRAKDRFCGACARARASV